MYAVSLRPLPFLTWPTNAIHVQINCLRPTVVCALKLLPKLSVAWYASGTNPDQNGKGGPGQAPQFNFPSGFPTILSLEKPHSFEQQKNHSWTSFSLTLLLPPPPPLPPSTPSTIRMRLVHPDTNHAVLPAPPPPSNAGGFQITRLLPRAATDSCHPQPDVDLCEKPALSSSTLFIAMIIMSVILVIGFLSFLLFLHRRRKRLDKMEDLKDPQELDDYGFVSHSTRPTPQSSGMPKAPPPSAQPRGQDFNGSKVQSSINNNRASQDSLTPSLRQALGRTPVDPFANR
ncbi:hypothetical protein BGZ63DRAFT_442280 [Mariannaea sp. PMI_226]|nr:hypothetical protein BGZ63DRAFT_442280 [Mariannaea sp. PMI_226]